MQTPLGSLLTLHRYVAELEQELAQARALLGQTRILSPTDRNMQPSQRSTTVVETASTTTVDVPQGSAVNRTPRQEHIMNGHHPALPAPSSRRHVSSPQLTKPSPNISLETPPPSGDFDWDERVVGNVDGMASLTNRHNGCGYLGVASGAALLRLADSVQTNSADGSDSDVVGEEPSHVPTPIMKTIYSLSQLEPFVDAYFQLYHISYPIVHEATFRAQVSAILASDHGIFG